MKKILFFAFVISLSSFTSVSGPGLSSSDRKFAVNNLKETREYLLNATKGLTEAQMNYKPDSTRWSIAQCLEHIALSETEIFKVEQNLMTTPADTSKRKEVKVTVEQIVTGAVDRSKKFNAPEFLKPANKFPSGTAALNAFIAQRNKTIEYMATTKEDLRDHFTPHPAFGMLDAYQWIILISAHSKRHTLQLEEVKADKNFPK